MSEEPKQNLGRELVDRKLVEAPQQFLLLAVQRRLFCFGSLVILDLHLSISNGFVSSKIDEKREDFDFGIVNFPFLHGYVPRLPLTVFTFLNSFDLLEWLVM